MCEQVGTGGGGGGRREAGEVEVQQTGRFVYRPSSLRCNPKRLERKEDLHCLQQGWKVLNKEDC